MKRELLFTLTENGNAYVLSGVGEYDALDVVIPAEHEGLPVTEIATHAFEECPWLASVTIPPSIRKIHCSAFENCYQLRAVHISDLSAWCRCNCSSAWQRLQPEDPRHEIVLNGTPIHHLVVPDDVAVLGRDTFAFSAIERVTIPATVRKIGSFAFATNLRECIFVDAAEHRSFVIDGSAFRGCTALTELTLPYDLTEIGFGAFADTAMERIVFPNQSVIWYGKRPAVISRAKHMTVFHYRRISFANPHKNAIRLAKGGYMGRFTFGRKRYAAWELFAYDADAKKPPRKLKQKWRI